MRRAFFWLGRCLLRVLPADFRNRYGHEVAEYFNERSTVIRQEKGWVGVAGFWIRGFADVVRTAIAERLDDRRDRLAATHQGRRGGRSLIAMIAQEPRHALRTMCRTPGFTLVALITLALGIGANVAMFSTAHAVLVQPLPYADSERLVIGRAIVRGELNPWVAGADYYDYRDRNDRFEHLAAVLPFAQNYTVTGGGDPERVAGAMVSTNLFATLGVVPEVGRGFAPEDGLAGAQDVLVISHGYWQRRFGSDPEVVGQTLNVNGNPFTVVGILPAGFRLWTNAEFWGPMRPDRFAASLRDRHNWYVVGRLRAGVTIEQAQGQVDVISSQLEAMYPETNEGKGLLLTDLHEMFVADYRAQLAVVTTAVALVLLIACANVTGMLLARAPARRVELSVRAALGASRSRLLVQLLAEAMLLAIGGGAVGIAIAVWSQQLILDFMQMEVPGVAADGLSPQMLATAVVLSLVAGLAAGVYPALSAVRRNLADDLKTGSRSLTNVGTAFRSGLVVAQVAVSVVLLIGSALLIRSLSLVSAVDPGFAAENLVTAAIELPRRDYPDGEARIQFFSRFLESARAVPGVSSAGIIDHLPIRSPRNVYGVHTLEEPESSSSAYLRSVMPGYFDTMRIPLLMGREIDDRDTDGTVLVAVINEQAAERFFAGTTPLGEQLQFDFFGDVTTVEVVGVVGDVRMGGLETTPRVALYLPYRQSPEFEMQVAVRSSADPDAVARALRTELQGLDGNVPLAGVAPMEDFIADSIAERRTMALALTLYAALPLILAAVGLYAVLAYYVRQRFHEIGIRVALGADGREIARMVLSRGTMLILVGVAIGVAGAVGLTRLIRQSLFGIEPTDLPTFVGVTFFVAAIALAACLVPVWRAVRVDPVIALQSE